MHDTTNEYSQHRPIGLCAGPQFDRHVARIGEAFGGLQWTMSSIRPRIRSSATYIWQTGLLIAPIGSVGSRLTRPGWVN